MKCKIHPYDQSGGVCASCLRDRLLDLQASLESAAPDLRRNPPPPSLFPRSASPRQRSSSSETSSAVSGCHRRFHRTPQVDRRESPGCQRFSLSWLSSLIHRRGGEKKKKNIETLKVSLPEPMRRRRSCSVSDRGMSPQDDVTESGYSTESSCTNRRRQTPSTLATVEARRRHGGGFSGFTVCLSPLVGPTCRRDLGGFSGELNRHVGIGGAPFGPNRSKKLADRCRFR